MEIDKNSLRQLKEETDNSAVVSISKATGAASFVRFVNNGKSDLSSLKDSADATEKSNSFFREHGELFGIADPDAELRIAKEDTDAVAWKHQTFQQFYNEVPVFAGVLKTHFDGENRLYAVNGTFVPQIEVDTNPAYNSDEAAAAAAADVAAEKKSAELFAKTPVLYVYRTGLIEGVPGEDYLTWEVEVTNNGDVREFVYVDAHSNKIVDRFTGIHDALNRRAFNGNGSTSATPPNYPGTPFWVEGQSFPTTDAEANNMLSASKESYDLFKNGFNRDSFDGTGGVMDAIFNRGNSCPNASWNGTFISFCPGITTDDVTAHEWGHAYTERTHGLIYQWQPGALNESYSDIYGEIVDRINNRDAVGNSETDPARTDASCSIYTTRAARLDINSPAAQSGTYTAQGATYGPALVSPLTGNVVQGLDAVAPTTDGCSAYTNAAAVAGEIVIVDSTGCAFTVKTKMAQDAGAVGVLIARTASNPTGLPGMSGVDSTITISSLGLTMTDGDRIRTSLASSVVNVTMRSIGAPSTRWMVGEDSTANGLVGALRDMYSPGCYGDPGKVSDAAYVCSTSDQGGVHTNSGVPNHAFALLVDGGTYNGQTITGIGVTKAAHIYFRAMNVYQRRDSDFSDHADSVEQSANDLRTLATNLADLLTGQPSGQTITAADVAQVQKAMLAVEMRTPPTQCNFVPLLGKNPPAQTACAVGTTRSTVFLDGFEGSSTGWTVGRENTLSSFVLPNWTVTSALPDNVAGKGFYATDPNIGDCTTAATNQKGVRFLKSPVIQIPAGVAVDPTLSFDHWIAVENGYDGGQLWISVNGGTFSLVPQANFTYNAHNATLLTTENDNPRAGQRAWSGSDGGSVSGSWGKTIVNLTGLVNPGNTVQFRWDLSTDLCGGTFAWYVDNPKIDACLTGPPVYEGDAAPRPNGDGVVQSNDTTQIQRFEIGLDRPFQSNEFQRADLAPFATRGNGIIDSADTTQSQRYEIGLDARQSADGPTAALSGNASTSTGAKSGEMSEQATANHQRQLRVESAASSAGQQVTVNIRVDAIGDDAGYGFTVNYNQAILTNPSVVIGTAGGQRVCNFMTAGQLACSVRNFADNQAGSSTDQIGEIPAGDNQMLVRVTFTVAAGTQAGTTDVTFSNVNASNDLAQSLVITSQNGTVTITAPTAASVSVSGRVLSSQGRGVRNAVITLTDANGNERTATTISFGYYRFDNVTAGETVTVTAKAKRYRFNQSSIVRTVNESIIDADFVVVD